MKPSRNWMAIKTDVIATSNKASDFKQISMADVPILARLMDVSYQGTIDHEGETLEQCAEEIKETISGKYGSFVSEASQLVIKDGKAISACLITMWKGKPLIAFSMTDPNHQRQGLSRALIANSVRELARMGESILYLVVTGGNVSAQNLYRKIGFKDLGQALPGQPPPEWK